MKKRITGRAMRLAALILCAAVLAVSIPVALSRDSVTLAQPATAPAQGSPFSAANADDGWVNSAFRTFTSAFTFLNYVISPREGLVYNEKKPFQALFGYNRVYDRFAFVANVYADSIACRFTYDNRDWLVQLWKGSYAVFLCTGGEIGVYNKPAGRRIEHYDAAKERDWLRMEMAIYNRGRKLFSRPFEEYWWCTGYQVSYLSNFWRAPRANCVMEARIQFKDETMAVLFVNELVKKGFTRAWSLDGISATDVYAYENDTVRLVWQYIND